MERRSFRIPFVFTVFAVPAAIVGFLPAYTATLVTSGGGHPDPRRVMATGATVFVAYSVGGALWLILRSRVSRDVALNLAIVGLVLDAVVTLFSFGHRGAGEVLLIGSVGGLVMSVPNNIWSAHMTLRLPTRGILFYWIVALELPAFILLAFAGRDYLSGNNTAAADFGTALFLYLTYLFGYLGWNAVRALSPPLALFAACFCAFWGLPVVMLLASLGPISLIPLVGGIGGAAGCLPYLWDESADNKPAASHG